MSQLSGSLPKNIYDRVNLRMATFDCDRMILLAPCELWNWVHMCIVKIVIKTYGSTLTEKYSRLVLLIVSSSLITNKIKNKHKYILKRDKTLTKILTLFNSRS